MADIIGSVVSGRYRVDAFLGRGGMAEVYKVWDQQRSVYLAMKVLSGDLAEDKVFVRRFHREGQTLAQLQHPNIVRFYGLEQDGDLVYMLMDYVEGTTLRKEIFQAKGPFALERVLQIMRPVCAALHYAHQSGFAHCDIKPANIMLHVNGTVLLADFGIARMTEAATSTLLGAGTPAYMAPEQVRGADPTPQTDIYALGVVLYEMLSGGERPYTGEHAQTTGSTTEKILWEKINLQAPPLAKVNPKATPALQLIIDRCLAKEPMRRYQTVTDFLSDLMRACSKGEPARAGATAIPPTPVSPDVTSVTALPEVQEVKAPPPVQQPPLPPPGAVRRSSRKLGVPIAFFSGIVVIGAVLFGVLGGRGGPLFAPASTPTATVTLTATASPSATPLPPTSTNTPTSTPTPGPQAKVKSSEVTLYQGPDLKHPLVSDTKYKNGTMFEILWQTPKGDWFLVMTTDGIAKGWLYKDWLYLPQSWNTIPTVSSLPTLPPTPTRKPTKKYP